MPEIATGFGGGMGRQGQTCGALSGAIMAVGLKHGRDAAEDAATKEHTYLLGTRLLQTCRDEFGGVGCVELLGCDIGTPEGMASFEQRNLYVEVCARVVAFAAEEAYRLLTEHT